MIPLDDLSQGALALKSVFDGLRSAISMVREIRSGKLYPKESAEESKLIDAALDKANAATALAEAQIAQALGFKLCKCRFPPTPMLTIGYFDRAVTNQIEAGDPVYECPRCNITTAGPWVFTRTDDQQ